jgi:hypothetical protein
VSSSQRIVSVGLVIVRAIVIVVTFIVSLTLDAVSFLVQVFNLVMCISVADKVTQVSAIPIPAMLL